jgi:cobalamin biosynthesis Mg chelatase CobN
MERMRGLPPEEREERAELAVLIQAQAAELDLAELEPAWTDDAESRIAKLHDKVLELEYTLIPHGLHVVGEAPSEEERLDLLLAVAEASKDMHPTRAAVEALVAGKTPEKALKAGGMATSHENVELFRELAETDRLWFRTPRPRRSCMHSTAASFAPHRAATCCARRRSCRPGATCMASTPSVCRAPTRSRTVRAKHNV